MRHRIIILVGLVASMLLLYRLPRAEQDADSINRTAPYSGVRLPTTPRLARLPAPRQFSAAGITFTVPSIASTTASAPHTISRADQSIFVSVPLQVLSGAAKDTFGIVVSRNPSRQSLKSWFSANVHPLSSFAPGALEERSLPDGRRLIVFQGPIPGDYEGEPLAGVYMASPDGQRIVAIARSQDDDLGLLGINVQEYQQLAIALAESVRFDQ